MSKSIRPRDLNLQELIMTVFNKLLLAQDNALTVSATKKRDVNTPIEKTGPPPNKLVLPVIALWAHFKTTWKLTAVNFIVIIECYIISCKDKV